MITVLLRSGDLELDRARVEGASYRHLFRARRLASGTRLRAVDGRGEARWATVERVDRRVAVLALEDPAPSHEPDFRLQLMVAPLRSERASWLVEKATEIGVRAVRFVATERTPRRYGSANLDRLRRVAAAALEQSHRSRLPEIFGVDSWDAATARLAGDGAEIGDRFYLDPDAEASEIRPGQDGSGIVLIGPEGGWSPSETEQLDRLGCRGVCLGPRTLRVETAAVAAAVKLLL